MLETSEHPRVRPGSPAAYLLAALTVAAALALRVVLTPWLVGAQFITFFPAVIVATYFLGAAAGLFSIAVAAVAAWYFLGSGGLTFQEGNSLVMFVGVALMDVAIITALRASAARVRRLNVELSQSEAKFRDLLDSAPDAMVVVDEQDRIALCNAATEQLFGYRHAQLLGQPVERLIPGRFRDRHAGLVRDFRARPDVRPMGVGREVRGLRKDGSEVAVEVSLSSHRTDGTRLVTATIRDVTERKAAAELQTLLIHELNHRVKNVLASVQSIASQTLATAATPEDFGRAFTDRLMALSHSHDLLTANDWAGAAVGDLVEAQLRPYQSPDGERLNLAGPQLQLSPKVAVTLGMVIGELATNAAKYGALSQNGGTVGITWERFVREGEPWLRLAWRERDGPPVRPPARRGFGTRLVERGLQHELSGAARLAFEATGLVCELEFPLRETPA